MKVFATFVLLVACAQAIDFSKLKPKEMPLPPLFPKYTGAEWDRIKSTQNVAPVPYPGFKPGTKPQPASAGHTRIHTDSRIVGGHVAQHGQFPWQALINMDESYLCGGSLIAEDWILTAGHCGDGFSSFVVLLGAQSSQGGDTGSIALKTYDVTVHEEYDPNRIDNDIALLRLPNSVSTSEYINVVALAPSNIGDLVDETVTVSGWGKYHDNSGVSPDLRYVSMPVMDNRICANSYGDVITSSKICTDTQGGHSTCNGDSGGPLVYQYGGGYVEVGIVSFGSSAGCEVGYPAVFTRVSSFIQWIESHTGIKLR